jgi:hypothetical protein
MPEGILIVLTIGIATTFINIWIGFIICMIAVCMTIVGFWKHINNSS